MPIEKKFGAGLAGSALRASGRGPMFMGLR